jgi:hypothetical protein
MVPPLEVHTSCPFLMMVESAMDSMKPSPNAVSDWRSALWLWLSGEFSSASEQMACALMRERPEMVFWP